jgi:hypothetical protein
MKKILTVIGAFFARIWTWIKETAWVQPLLIVGIIFAVIFSIPSISEWIQGIADNANSAETYYRKYDKSLDGEENSDAQKLVNAMMENDDQYGEKFFLILVQEDCTGCEEMQPAVDLLRTKTNRFYDKDTFSDFKFYTIFTDEEVDADKDYTNTAWDRFVDRNDDFLVRAAEVAENSWYKVNGYITESNIEGLEDGSNIVTPTIILFDLTDSNPFELGISEVFFGAAGSTSYEKAELLAHAWTHTEEFTI